MLEAKWGWGGLMVRGLGPPPLLAPLRRHLPSLGLGSQTRGRKTHGRTADQPKVPGKSRPEKPGRRDSWCLVSGLNREPAVPRLEAPQRLEVTRQPTHFLPKLPQVQGATSNLNFARPEGKSENHLILRPHRGNAVLANPAPTARRGKWCVPQLRAPGQAGIKGSLYPKVLAAKAKSGDPGPT